MLVEELGILTVANHRKQPVMQQFYLSITVAHHMSVLLQEAISDGGERLGGELLGAFALQVAVEGRDGYSGVNCVALRVKGGAVGHAKKTAARVGMDIGTLGGKLGGIDRHDIAIAWVEERGKRGGGRGLGDGIAKRRRGTRRRRGIRHNGCSKRC